MLQSDSPLRGISSPLKASRGFASQLSRPILIHRYVLFSFPGWGIRQASPPCDLPSRLFPRVAAKGLASASGLFQECIPARLSSLFQMAFAMPMTPVLRAVSPHWEVSITGSQGICRGPVPGDPDPQVKTIRGNAPKVDISSMLLIYSRSDFGVRSAPRIQETVVKHVQNRGRCLSCSRTHLFVVLFPKC